MKIKFNRPTVYLSHPIRGQTGDIVANCKKAEAAARRLRRTFPDVDFYVPAEHDLTLQILSSDNRLSIDDIMYADLQILQACHGFLLYEHQPSAGCRIEYDEADNIGMPIEVVASDIEKMSSEKLRDMLWVFISQTIHCFKKESEYVQMFCLRKDF